MASSGWGESVAGEGPFYAPETVETAWHILRDFIWPMLKGREFANAAEVWEALDPDSRSQHGERRGRVRHMGLPRPSQKNLPLWKLLGGVHQRNLLRRFDRY